MQSDDMFIKDIAEPKSYGFITLHINNKDYKGILFLFEDTESILEFIKKMRKTEVSYWM